MQKTIKDIHEYYEVITKIWAFFRKFYTDYDADKSVEAVQEFEAWIKYKGPRLYEFGMQIIRIAWRELGQLEEMRLQNEQENQS